MEIEIKNEDINVSQTSSVVMAQNDEFERTPKVIFSKLKDGKFVAIKENDSCRYTFTGQTEGLSLFNRMIGEDYAEMQELLIRAVNNRTRQRNYFQLLTNMLEGNITEDEFYEKIENNCDNYVVEEIESPTKERLLHALFLCQNIKDVCNSEDLSTLFSFDSIATDNELKKLM